jgi:hypothetical protein
MEFYFQRKISEQAELGRMNSFPGAALQAKIILCIDRVGPAH